MWMALRCCLDYIPLSINSFVRNDAAPVECLDDIFLCSRNESLRVGILNTDDEITSALLCEEVVI